ncbi:MAG: HAD-IA family hydrolase [Synergistaceae bacterium]|jgi:HAD superfamily hydrolase (TIGR01549 family)|nr:HAD-IA family hydrolase [Synergistaceae bacterium]
MPQKNVSSIRHPAEAGAFILDWDGVLADTWLNFKPLRQKYFDGKIVPLVEAAAELPPTIRAEVLAEIRRIEIEGAEKAVPVEGAKDLIAWLNTPKKLVSGKSVQTKPWAVVSRNCRDSILLAAEKCGITLPPVFLCREDPYVKPDPRALALAAKRLRARLSDCVMVGDFIYDLQAAKNASIPSVLVKNPATGSPDVSAEWEGLADFVYVSLVDFVKDLSAFEAPFSGMTP